MVQHVLSTDAAVTGIVKYMHIAEACRHRVLYVREEEVVGWILSFENLPWKTSHTVRFQLGLVRNLSVACCEAQEGSSRESKVKAG